MQAQYNKIKEQHPNDVVLFRLGDFYEAFDTDAQTLSKHLGITLTGRGKGESRMPMAGIPHHALDNYLPKLVNAGIKVVLVDQKSEPKPGQLVERDVAKVFTPGTLMEEGILSESRNNYIAAIAKSKSGFGLVLADISVGKLICTSLESPKQVIHELDRLGPAEILLNKEMHESLAQAGYKPANTVVTHRPDSDFDAVKAEQVALKQFSTKSLKGFGIHDKQAVVSALGGLLIYAAECQRSELLHIKRVSYYGIGNTMQLDSSTIRNLELFTPASGNDYKVTLFGCLNDCKTSMGKRKLYDWLLNPLTEADHLVQRWDAVGYLVNDTRSNSKLRDLLAMVADIERIVGRVGVGSANARDLLAIMLTLQAKDQLEQHLTDISTSNKLTNRLSALLGELSSAAFASELTQLIANGINPDAPAGLQEGGLIAAGYDLEVDQLRQLKAGGKDMLSQIQQREAARTGISTLKVSYNRVFGYYIEVSKAQNSKVPQDYIRKQTLANAERYITAELKEWEDKILNAETLLIQREYELFIGIRNKVAAHLSALLKLADAIAELDVLANYAHIARQRNYNQPQLASQQMLSIVEGRHPVIELLNNDFTANDLHLNGKSQSVVLTGPNMSGKSTYIRQIALIVLMAQSGGFVPAKELKFSLADRVFTRVGASDNLARGESTFMVEMNETANILNNATNKSLVILDEVGRGTSTYDGVAIAWAIMQYIAEKIGCYTLFATHYHELTEMSEAFASIVNYHVQVKEHNGEVVFQHKIVPGGTSKSYGVYVAKLAGVPAEVVLNATKILRQFESKSKKPTLATPKHISPRQLDLLK